jgi:hypothetical protein
MNDITISTVQTPVSLPAANAEQLNAAGKHTIGDSLIVFLADPATANMPALVEEIRTAFREIPDLAVLRLEAGERFSDGIPASVTAFLPMVSRLAGFAFRREAVMGEFPDLSEPIRAWLMQAAEQRHRQESRTLPIETRPAEIDDRLPMLRPDEPPARQGWLRERIERLDLRTLLPRIASPDDATAFRAGLLQMNDFLDASHQHSQRIEGAGRNAAGDYWHAIMHRREPDDSNARYWFRHVGSHPVFPRLASQADSLLNRFPAIAEHWRGPLLPGGRWDPFACVDLCRACSQSETDDLSRFARRLQWIEMQLLLEQTRRDATGE